MKRLRFEIPVLLAALWPAAGCGGAPVAAPAKAAPRGAPVATTSAAAGAAVMPGVPDGPPIQLHTVARIYSLMDVVATEGTIEVRIGYDESGGVTGYYRYAPIVNGAVDLDQETDPVGYVNASPGGSLRLVGKRPDLLRHAAAGFRASATDTYQILGSNGLWTKFPTPEAAGVGLGIFRWSAGRLLEWRTTAFGTWRGGEGGGKETAPETKHSLPGFRVLRGADDKAPSLPAALQKRLVDEEFYTSTLTAFPSGEVVAVGVYRKDATKLGTLIWRADLGSPEHFTTPVVPVPPSTSGSADPAMFEPAILGGDSLSTVRLQYGRSVMKLDGAAWTQESTVDDRGLPDVWFGAPLVRNTSRGPYARMAAGAPWSPLGMPPPLPAVKPSTRPVDPDAAPEEAPQNVDDGLGPFPPTFAIDGAGVIWGVLDQVLVSSKPPAGPPIEVTEEDLVKRRRKSVLLGGSTDVTGARASISTPWTATCALWYVPLDRRPIPANDTIDYAAVRKKLEGYPEFAGARFVVSRERGMQLLGAQLADRGLAFDLLQMLMPEGERGGHPLCADPQVVREIKIKFRAAPVVR